MKGSVDRTASRKPCPSGCREDGYTGLDLVSWGAIAFITCALLVHLLAGAHGAANPQGGIIPRAIQQSGDQLNVFGSITGFPADPGLTGGIPVRWPDPNPGRLGGVGMSLSLFIGSTGGIDMAHTTVLWTDASGTQQVPLSKDRPLLCPNWTIVQKLNVIPLKSADDDDILEPGEKFDVIICSFRTYAPYEEFTIEYEPPGSGPHFPVKCTVPFPITRTMEL